MQCAAFLMTVSSIDMLVLVIIMVLAPNNNIQYFQYFPMCLDLLYAVTSPYPSTIYRSTTIREGKILEII